MTDWLIVSATVAALLFVAYGIFCAREIFAVNAEIRRVLDGLTADNAETLFAETRRLLPAWKDFAASLTSDKKFSIASAVEFFSPQNLTRGLNMSFWQAYGGIFTGLGILGTFLGLTLGLRGVDMTSTDIEVLKSGIANLLSGVEKAFVTSLVGIFCALAYNILHHMLMKNFQQKLAQLSARLDEKFPRRIAEDWLAKSLAEQQIHTATLQKLVDAMDKFTSGGADKVGEVFTEKVGTQMDNFSDALDKFTAAITDNLIKALCDHATQTQNSVDNFNKTVDEQRQLLTTVTNDNAAQINDALKKFNGVINANRDILGQIRQMLDASANFLRAVNTSGTALNNAAENVRQADSQLLTKLPELADQMNKLLKANEFTRENLDKLSTQVATFVENFNGIADELERAVTLIRDAIKGYNDVTNDGLQEKLRVFDKSMTAAFGHLQSLVEDLSDALADFNQNRRR